MRPTKPEVVAVAPEHTVAEASKTLDQPTQVAADAPKILGLPIATTGPVILRPKQIAIKTPSILGLPATKAKNTNATALKPREVAAAAPKMLGFHAASESLSVIDRTRSASVREDWDVLPPDKGGLVLFIPRVVSDRAVVVRDEMGKLLDSVYAKAGAPLLRQFRLDPGTYELNLEGFADVAVTIRSGKLATIELSQDRVTVTNKRSPDWKPVIDNPKAGGSNIGSQDISSATRVLRFTAELPGR
jgi:hypothetical protein